MSEKRVFIAIILSFLVLAFWQKVIMPRYAPATVTPPAVSDVVAESGASKAQTVQAATPHEEEKTTTLEDEKIKVIFSNIGATIKELSLKTFKDLDEAVYVVQSEDVRPETLGVDVTGRANLEHVAFEHVSSAANEVVYRYEKAGEFRLTKRFQIQKEPAYCLHVSFIWENLSSSALHLEPQTTLSFFSGASHASIDVTALHVLGLRNDQVISKNSGKIKKGVYENGPLDWVGLEKKYFTLLLKDRQGTFGSLEAKSEEADHVKLQTKLAAIDLPVSQKQTQEFLLYAGPKRVAELKACGVGFDKVFAQGMLGFLRVAFLWLLNFFFGFLHNYGLAILALTILIRVILSPLMHFSFDSMKKMQEVQPKIEALKQQYSKDPQKLNQEMMALFKRHKVNPFGGCLPMVIQIPIFIALWQVLSQAIELKGAPFYLWITDLSMQDHLWTLPFTLPWFGNVISLLPILTTATMLLQQALTPTTNSAPEQRMMMWMMSILFGVMFYKMPSGVLLYWCASNIITIVHQMILFQKGPFRPRPA